jgi:hypothetical protein
MHRQARSQFNSRQPADLDETSSYTKLIPRYGKYYVQEIQITQTQYRIRTTLPLTRLLAAKNSTM